MTCSILSLPGRQPHFREALERMELFLSSVKGDRGLGGRPLVLVLQLVAGVAFGGGRHSRTDPSVLREELLSQAQQGSVV